MSEIRTALHLTIAKTMDDGREVSRPYRLRQIEGEAPGWTLAYDDDNGTTLIYSVRMDRDTPHCTCRDTSFRGRECKHILSLKNEGLIQ